MKIKVKQYSRYSMSEGEIFRAEKDKEKKTEIVKKYVENWSKYTVEVDGKIDQILKNDFTYQGRKDLEWLKMDMRFCRFAYGFQPDEYLVFRLEKKDMHERQSYISDRQRYIYVYSMNDIIDVNIYLDKYKTYKKFKKYYKREAIEIKKPSDFEKFQEFVKKYPTFVKKRVELSRGASVSLENIGSCGLTVHEYFNNLIAEGTLILEEKVQQNQEMSALNPSSVNTVRCITFNTREGIVIPYTFLKTGQNGSFVDNGGAGGILIGIDSNKGCLSTDGIDEFNVKYEKHPDTKIKFQGYQLPDWQQLIEICSSAASQTPSVRYIGWDMAYTKDGWIIIEGNGLGQFIGPQIVLEKGIKEEVEKVMKHIEML